MSNPPTRWSQYAEGLFVAAPGKEIRQPDDQRQSERERPAEVDQVDHDHPGDQSRDELDEREPEPAEVVPRRDEDEQLEAET